ncbi:hypothetical protein FB45DRAFT_901075 [Roridomyces roridus]|uniref:Uncharacterized protein n=1 Tax=Roridomyces roridus TaxID=1738132 RepID=A0AAD7C8I1_9AGAR|nr:hypothetical protein FB45DRAFT_901075 [Roridomyces roridus]
MPKPTLLSVLVGLTALSTALNLWLVRQVREAASEHSVHNIDYPYEPRELPGSFPSAALTFAVPDTEYPLRDDESWASTVPPQRGFIRLGSSGRPWSVSAYHQAHCVNGIRFSYVSARDGLFKTEESRAHAFGHVNHCFDVLRQSILCRADTTLVEVPGGEQTRRCRDWTRVREFIDENHEFWRDVPFVMTNSSSTT